MNQTLIHWEQKEQIGFFRTFWETLKLSMLEPSRFFEAVPSVGGYGKPLVYGMICMSLGVIFSTLYQIFFQGLGTLIQYAAHLPVKEAMMGTGFSIMVGVGIVIASPVSSIVSLFVFSGINHLFLMMFGSGRKGFETTFRAYAYSQGPQILQIIPIFGSIATLVWHYTILVIGYKKLQAASTAQALGAALLPLVLICGLTMFVIGVVAMLIIMFAASMAHH